MAKLTAYINQELQSLFEREKSKGRDHLAGVLVQWVEDFVLETLNTAGYDFGRLEYGGDINFENSHQTFGNGDQTDPGLILEFHGFACTVSWA